MIGLCIPMLEWRRFGLYQHSIHSKMALASSSRVRHILESSNSSCIVPQNDSIITVVAIPDGWNGYVDHDPTGQILSSWIAKEELRVLCATAACGGHPGEIRDRLWVFYQWCADARIPELTTLAETIEWPAIEVFLTTGLNTPGPRARTG